MVSYSWMNIPGVKTWLDTPESFWNTNDDWNANESSTQPFKKPWLKMSEQWIPWAR